MKAANRKEDDVLDSVYHVCTFNAFLIERGGGGVHVTYFYHRIGNYNANRILILPDFR